MTHDEKCEDGLEHYNIPSNCYCIDRAIAAARHEWLLKGVLEMYYRAHHEKFTREQAYQVFASDAARIVAEMEGKP